MSKAVAGAEANRATRFSESIIRVLRPLIRLMIGNMTYNAFVTLAKQIYVEEAERELEIRDPSGRVTKSALSLITGIDTRGITQILNERKEEEELNEIYLMPEAEVLAEWGIKPEFRDENDRPIDLPVYGRGLTFQNLVTRAAGRNVTAQTVLDRLVASGNIELVDENTVRLLSRIYFPLGGSEYEALDVGMLAAANLLKTVHYNVSIKEDTKGRHVQQQRWSLSIPKDKYEEFKKAITEQLRQHVDESLRIIEFYENESKGIDTFTAGVGVYYFEDVEEKST